MLTRHVEPIVAIATAPGRGAVGIVRISGRSLDNFVEKFFGKTLVPREAKYVPFRDSLGKPLDHGLAIYFPAPHSFTGEDVLELQAHGGPVVLQLLVARCLEIAATQEMNSAMQVLPHLRIADPGEFTQRAFLNGKIDLAQAEAIADLIDASTEAAARSASLSLAGTFSKRIHSLRDALIQLRMLVEATLDFPEEEIDFLKKSDAQGQLETIQTNLAEVLKESTQGALLRQGIRVVIVGQPNAGKSSLLNALAGAELAIVTPIPGTTRDRVQETIQIHGVPIHIIDTAGLRDSSDSVEQMGIARTWDAVGTADLVLFLHDLTRMEQAGYVDDDLAIGQSIVQKIATAVPVIDVWNKADLQHERTEVNGLRLSAKSGMGIEALRQELLKAVGWQADAGSGFLARERHLQALQRVGQHLRIAALHLSNEAQALDLLSEELRLSQNALNTITGEFTSDDLLGVIFSKFCIGK
jgi:tRNA modification GTPase